MRSERIGNYLFFFFVLFRMTLPVFAGMAAICVGLALTGCGSFGGTYEASNGVHRHRFGWARPT